MATDKRARQRANREQKRVEEAKQARRQRTFKLVRRAVFYAVIIAGVLFLASLAWGSG
jgi:hypothetical protein